ncbi:phosphatidylethanolamine-binding protein 4 [Onychomys torridus]|uniref:phosphatidylethanolamine-binding protein 4 n=1 Tax=Onychomys torridus TaxID=38674 RepID=UPI00167FAD74|nr:phosphatidylethanolamine-binding protein 4 [Onychomys torridus]
MKMCAVALCLCLLAAAVWLGLSMTTSESSGGGGGGGGSGGGGGGGSGKGKKCAPTPLPKADVSLCRNLEVSYPELGNISCQIVPKCNQYRQKITRWPQPKVKFPAALDGSYYVLVMVDPDAPSRADPRMKYWRHWVVFNVKGADMKTGNIRGSVVTDYDPPTPPPTTGLHRYQFLVFLQGTSTISVPYKENGNRGPQLPRQKDEALTGIQPTDILPWGFLEEWNTDWALTSAMRDVAMLEPDAVAPRVNRQGQRLEAEGESQVNIISTLANLFSTSSWQKQWPLSKATPTASAAQDINTRGCLPLEASDGVLTTLPCAKKNPDGYQGAWQMEDFLQNYQMQQPQTSTQFMTEFDGAFNRMNEAKGQFSDR